MLSTGPASIAIVEASKFGMSTSHHKDERALVQSLLRDRRYFAMVVEELPAAQAIWAQEAVDDARRDAGEGADDYE